MRILALAAPLVLAAGGLAFPALAQESNSYLSGEAMFMRGDDDRGVDDEGVGVRALYGRRWSGNWYLEGQFFSGVLETRSDLFGFTDTDFYQAGLGLDLVYAFGDRNSFTPFVLAGLGVVRDDAIPDDDDSTNLFGNAGLGFVVQISEKLGVRLRGDARYLYDDFETTINPTSTQSGMGDWNVGLGLEVPLGRREVERTVEVEKIVEVPVEKIVEVPVPMPVEKQRIVLEGVRFKFDSSELLPESLTILDGVAETLRGMSDITVEIAGFACDIGDCDYNIGLSERRAASVRDYLVSKGVAAEILVPRGYGESAPAVPNTDEEARKKNRRVELRILHTP